MQLSALGFQLSFFGSICCERDEKTPPTTKAQKQKRAVSF
jgi:hypothetical protein